MEGGAAPLAGSGPRADGLDPMAVARLRRYAVRLWVAVAVPVNLLIVLGRTAWGPEGPLLDRAYIDWDGRWFLTIARDGYVYVPGQQSNVVFAPAYPLVSRALGRVVGSLPLAMVLVAAVLGLVSFVLFAAWLARREAEPRVRLTLVLLALYPFTMYLTGIPYSEPLYLATALGAFLALESDRPLLAGLLGAVTSATRVTGVALVAGLVVLVVTRSGAVRRATDDDLGPGPTAGWRLGPVVLAPGRLRPRDGWVLVSVGGLALWMAYFRHRFGDPVLFSSGNFGAPGKWLAEPSLRTLFKVQYVENFGEVGSSFLVTTTLQGVLAVASVALLPAVVRRYGAAYGVYCGVIIALSWITSAAFQSFGRYLLVAFPLFGVTAAWAERSPRRVEWLTRSFALGLFVAVVMWGQGFWVT
jgi:hypothetical protein